MSPRATCQAARTMTAAASRPAAAAAARPGVPLKWPGDGALAGCQVTEKGTATVRPARATAVSQDAASASHRLMAILGDRRAQPRLSPAGPPKPAART